MGNPRRRQSRRTSADPEALASQLPEDLRTWHPVPESHHFHYHARRIAEWLNTRQTGLGYLTPDVMAAAGLTASAWFHRSLALPPRAGLLDGPQSDLSRSRAPSEATDVAEDGAQGTAEVSGDKREDEPSWFVHPELLEAPEVQPRALGPRLIVVDAEG